MVALKIEHHLVFYYPAETSGIVCILVEGDKAYVRLPVFIILIVYNENQPFFKGIVEVILNFFKFLLCIIGCKLGQIPSVFVEVTVKIVEPVIRPVIVIILHPVFPESHLMSVIELTFSIQETKACQQGQKESVTFPHSGSFTLQNGLKYPQILFQKSIAREQN